MIFSFAARIQDGGLSSSLICPSMTQAPPPPLMLSVLVISQLSSTEEICTSKFCMKHRIFLSALFMCKSPLLTKCNKHAIIVLNLPVFCKSITLFSQTSLIMLELIKNAPDQIQYCCPVSPFSVLSIFYPHLFLVRACFIHCDLLYDTLHC